MAKLLATPNKNGIQKTLAAELLSTASTGDAITFADVDGIPNLPGVLVIDRIDSAGTATPSKREYIEYSGTSGTTVLITTRNADSSGTAQTHAVGAIVEFVPDVVWAGRLYTAVSNFINPSDVSALASGMTLSSPTLLSPNIPLSLGWFNSSGATITGVIDDDTMATASATTLATSESVKAYADNNFGKQTSAASSATPTPTGNYKTNELYLTALAAAAEFQAPSGTPVNGNRLVIRVKDNGTARALTYNAIYDGLYDTLPATTTISKTLYMLFLYNSTATKWEMVATIEEE